MPTPQEIAEAMMNGMMQEVEPFIVEASKGMDAVNALIDEYDQKCSADPEYAQASVLVLKMPGMETDRQDNHAVCCSQHARSLAQVMLTYNDSGHIEAWQQIGHMLVRDIMDPKSPGDLRERIAMLTQSIETIKYGIMTALDKGGWLEVIKARRGEIMGDGKAH